MSKQFLITLMALVPESQASNHYGFSIGNSGYNAIHLNRAEIIDEIAELGYSDLSSEFKVYDENGIFDADLTFSNLMAAFDNIASGVSELLGYVIVNIEELKSLRSCGAYIEAYGVSSKE